MKTMQERSRHFFLWFYGFSFLFSFCFIFFFFYFSPHEIRNRALVDPTKSLTHVMNPPPTHPIPRKLKQCKSGAGISFYCVSFLFSFLLISVLKSDLFHPFHFPFLFPLKRITRNLVQRAWWCICC